MAPFANCWQNPPMPVEPDRLLGESPVMLKTLEEVSQVAPLDKPVLVVGERGTGKELIAARLHYLSNRWEGPFLKLNCAAISDSLLETELFGHEAGAFTGATRTHHGRFERADGGTLFLDELANTSPLVQEKLLRVIEYGEFERVGGNKTLSCDVRLVAATNEDLPALAAAGQFRFDLLDRLAFDVITLPPLREREEDILLLAEQFAQHLEVFLVAFTISLIDQHHRRDKGHAPLVARVAILEAQRGNAFFIEQSQRFLVLLDGKALQIKHQQHQVGPADQVIKLRLVEFRAQRRRVKKLNLDILIGHHARRWDLRGEGIHSHIGLGVGQRGDEA